MTNLIIVTFVVGVLGLGLGGMIGALIGSISKRFNAMLLSFSAGTMIALVCFELLHEAMESGADTALIAAAALIGAGLVSFLDYIIDRHSGHTRDFITCEGCDEEFEHDENHRHCVEHGQVTESHHHKKASHLQLFLAGVMMAIGVAIHNIPEGMSIGALYAEGGGRISGSLTVLLISIVMHNIPEGMAIALPLFTSGMSKPRAALCAAATGIPTVLGALAGTSIGNMGALRTALSLSFAAGTLLYVVFGEVLPQSINLYCSRKTAFSAITGLIIGMLIIGMHVH